jgi:hypothetical protein
MTTTPYKKELIVLVADRNMEFTVKGLLGRPQSLKIKDVSYDIYNHPENDPGCRSNGANFLRPFVNQYSRALLMFDKAGCGQENQPRADLEVVVEAQLTASGWGDRSAAIVIEPELENWVWSDSPHVEAVLGWQGRHPNLRSWLISEGHLPDMQSKPSDPKEAMIVALRHAQVARSSSLFFQLAQRVSFERCDDPAFLKFKTTLSTWFSAG